VSPDGASDHFGRCGEGSGCLPTGGVRWDSIVLATCWSIWRERNRCVFQGKSLEGSGVLRTIWLDLSAWLVALPPRRRELLQSLLNLCS